MAGGDGEDQRIRFGARLQADESLFVEGDEPFLFAFLKHRLRVNGLTGFHHQDLNMLLEIHLLPSFYMDKLGCSCPGRASHRALADANRASL